MKSTQKKVLQQMTRLYDEFAFPILVLAIALSISISGCGGGGGGGGVTPEAPESKQEVQDVISTDKIQVPESFNFENRLAYRVAIRVYDPNGNPYIGVPVYIQTRDEGQILKGITDSSGVLAATRKFPPHVKEVDVTASALGIANSAVLQLDGSGVLSHTFQ